MKCYFYIKLKNGKCCGDMASSHGFTSIQCTEVKEIRCVSRVLTLFHNLANHHMVVLKDIIYEMLFLNLCGKCCGNMSSSHGYASATEKKSLHCTQTSSFDLNATINCRWNSMHMTGHGLNNMYITPKLVLQYCHDRVYSTAQIHARNLLQ